MNVKIIVATHKEYGMPKEDIYLPVFVGAKVSDLDLPYQRDDEGENISDKNRYYCELTGLYWAYRNLKADHVGLCHYRRYFDLSGIDITKYDVIVTRKRNYYIETVYDQFRHAHGEEPLLVVRKILERDYPGYLAAFDDQMKGKTLHLYNMSIMRYDIFVDYCGFLFEVLFKAEKELGDIDRLYGYLGERLLDVYLKANGIGYKEVNVINTEKTDWVKKIYAFLKRKYSYQKNMKNI